MMEEIRRSPKRERNSWNLLTLRGDLLLVTGDKLLLQDAAMLPRVISPLALVIHLQH